MEQMKIIQYNLHVYIYTCIHNITYILSFIIIDNYIYVILMCIYDNNIINSLNDNNRIGTGTSK